MKPSTLSKSIATFTIVSSAALLHAHAQVHILGGPAPTGPLQANNKMDLRVMTTLVTSNALGVFGVPTNMKATLMAKAAGYSVVNQTIVFKDENGLTLGTANTDMNGVAHFSLSDDKLIGPHKIFAYYAGSPSLGPANADAATLNIMQATTRIKDEALSIIDMPGPTGNACIVSGKLVRDTDGSVLKGRNIYATLNGTTFATVATDFEGKFYLSNSSKCVAGAGTYFLQALFDTDNYYVGTATTKKQFVFNGLPTGVKVNYEDVVGPIVQVLPKQAYYTVGQRVTFQAAELAKGFPNGIPNLGMNIGPDGFGTQLYQVKSDATGTASLPWQLKHAGKAVQVYAGVSDISFTNSKPGVNQHYEGARPIEIVKATPVISIQGPATAKVGSTVAITIALSNLEYADDPVEENFKLSINGDPITKGVTKVYIPASWGTGRQAIEVRFPGNEDYQPMTSMWYVDISY